MSTPAGAPGVDPPTAFPATGVPAAYKEEEGFEDIPIVQPVNVGSGGAPVPGVPYNQGAQYKV